VTTNAVCRFYSLTSQLYESDGTGRVLPGDISTDIMKNRLFNGLLKAYGLPPRGDPTWLGYEKILAQEWFKRVWIIQEVSVSRHPKVMYRQRQVDWDQFVTATMFLELMNALPDAEFKQKHGFGMSYPTYVLENQRNEFQDGVRHDLFHLVERFRPFLQTKPEDKVISLQGLASNTVPVDYAMGPVRFFATYTFDTIMRTSSLDILENVECNHGEVRLCHGSQALPSWVPDWSKSIRKVSDIPRIPTARMKRVTAKSYAAARSSQIPELLPETLHLKLRVQFVDTVRAVLPTPQALLDMTLFSEPQNPATGTKPSLWQGFHELLDTFSRFHPLNAALVEQTTFATSQKSRVSQILSNSRIIRKLFKIENYPTGESHLVAYCNLLGEADEDMPSPSLTKNTLSWWLPLVPLLDICISPFGRPSKFMWICLIINILGLWTLVSMPVVGWMAMEYAIESVITKFQSWVPSVWLGRLFNRFSVKKRLWNWIISTGSRKERLTNTDIFGRDIRHQKLIRTEKGYLGNAPCSVRPGDAIVLIPGASIPFILQQNIHDLSLVGGAYIYGMMRGQLFDFEQCKEIVLA